MKKYMMQAFAEVYSGEPVSFPLLDSDAIIRLKTRYESQDWLYGKPFPFSCTLEGQLPFGHLQLQLQVEQGVITAMQCYTDAMDSELPEKLSDALTGCPFLCDAMCRRLSTLETADTLIPFLQSQL